MVRQFCIDATHPCLDGHFPGAPIVPGVLLLDLVRLVLREWKPGSRIHGFPNAKFHHPLYPDEPFRVTLTESGPGSIRFVCQRDDRTLASGSLNLENPD